MKRKEIEVVSDKNLIAYCGLYCGACKSFQSKNCPGCLVNEKATWCKIRKCNIDNHFASCADCTYVDLEVCKNFNTPISKILSVLFNSNRYACIMMIRERGYETYAVDMASMRMRTIPLKEKSIKNQIK